MEAVECKKKNTDFAIDLAFTHYQRILSETDLLLKYAEVYGYNNLLDAIESIIYQLERLSKIRNEGNCSRK